MTLFGIPIRKPTFGELTAAGVMAVGLWLAAVGLMSGLHHKLELADAGALLMVLLWGCFSARLGIHVGKGSRHMFVNLLVTSVLLGVYQTVWSLAA